jgi:hypothetical protein
MEWNGNRNQRCIDRQRAPFWPTQTDFLMNECKRAHVILRSGCVALPYHSRPESRLFACPELSSDSLTS